MNQKTMAAYSAGVPQKRVLERFGLFLALMVLPFFVGKYLLGGADTDLSVPHLYSEDFLGQMGGIKGLIRGDWFPFFGIRIQQLGAPFGLNLGDFATPEQLQYLIIKFISLFHSDVFWVTNFYYVICFPLSALSFYWVARKLNIHSFFAAALSLVFTCLPFHFFRLGHLLLSAYYFVPFIWLLVLQATQVLPTQPLSFRAQLIIAALIGAWHPYYAFFFLSIFSFCITVFSLRTGEFKPFLKNSLILVTTVASLVVCTLPNLIYQARHGKNPTVALRGTKESLLYSLRPANFLVPDSTHRVPFIAKLAKKVDEKEAIFIEGRREYMGFFAIVGMLIAVSYFICQRPGWPLLNQLGLGCLFILLLGLTGGISLFFSYCVTPQFRSYNRISVILACAGLFTVGIVLSRFMGESGMPSSGMPGSRGGSRVQTLVVALFIAFAGPYDQLNPGLVRQMDPSEFYSDRTFFSELEKRLSKPAVAKPQVTKPQVIKPQAALQLPFVPYPESPVALGQMRDYDHMRAYLHTSHLSWSYGTTKGRPESNRIESLSRSPLDLAKIRGMGYSVIYINRNGYEDRGQQILDQLGREIKEPPLVSPNGNLVVYFLNGQ